MKWNKTAIQQLLVLYNRYLRQRFNLILAHRNIRRQHILSKHLARIERKLSNLGLTMRRVTVATGISGAALFQSQDAQAQITFAPPVTNPYSLTTVGQYTMPSLGDLDNDGDLDIICSEYVGNFIYIQNTGTASAPSFAAPQTNPFGLANTTYLTFPTLVDIDNDGDLDLFSGISSGGINFYLNTGTAAAPTFAAPQTNPFSLVGLSYNPILTFGDLDDDGDLDLLLGHDYTDMVYFQNTGTVSAPSFGTPQINPFGLNNTQPLPMPSLVDMDNDGDLDVMSGELYGSFQYFQNNGNPTTPTFAPAQSNPFSLTNFSGYAKFSMGDLDNDGDLDILCGGAYGAFTYYQNNSSCVLNASVSAASLTLTCNNVGATSYQWVTCPNLTPAPGVSTNQTYTAQTSGSYAVIVVLNNCTDTSTCVPVISVDVENTPTTNFSVYPNPTQGTFTLRLKEDATVILRNEVGQTVKQITVNARNNYTVQVDELPSGVYFLEATLGQEMIREKITVVK
jgi:hypothetical protein